MARQSVPGGRTRQVIATAGECQVLLLVRVLLQVKENLYVGRGSRWYPMEGSVSERDAFPPCTKVSAQHKRAKADRPPGRHVGHVVLGRDFYEPVRALHRVAFSGCAESGGQAQGKVPNPIGSMYIQTGRPSHPSIGMDPIHIPCQLGLTLLLFACRVGPSIRNGHRGEGATNSAPITCPWRCTSGACNGMGRHGLAAGRQLRQSTCSDQPESCGTAPNPEPPAMDGSMTGSWS